MSAAARAPWPCLLLASACGGGAPAPPPDVAALEKLVAEQKYSEAVGPLERAAAAGDARALELLGLSQLELHRFPEAAATFERLRAKRPGDVPAEIGLARALELQGKLADAAAALDRALASDSNRSEALYAAGQLAARRNLDARAKELLERALARAPWTDASAAAHYALSGIAARAGDGEAARRERALYESKFDWSTRRTAVERRLASHPDDVPSRRKLAALYREAGNGAAAVALLTPLLPALPRDCKLRVELAEARAAANDEAGAFEADADALRVDPSCAAAHRHRAQLHLARGKADDAFASLEAALELDPAATSEPSLRGVAREIEKKARTAGSASLAERAAQVVSRLGG